jgi:serine/threonine protein kinase
MHQSRSRGQLSQGQRSCNASIASTTDDEDYNSSCCTDDSSVGAHSGSAGAPAAAAALPLQGRLRVNMRWLLLTLLEVAEGMAYLHRMGVVHCDMKPANVLLKSSNADIRGFSAKVSDFGLSRVEDDDTCATFPFNSCGTAAYVAPEALITTKKVCHESHVMSHTS